MSDLHNQPTEPIAARDHSCKFCCGLIPKGEKHYKQTGVFDGSWYSNRYHGECWEDLDSQGETEFMPGDGDVPARIVALMEQRANTSDAAA